MSKKEIYLKEEVGFIPKKKKGTKKKDEKKKDKEQWQNYSQK